MKTFFLKIFKETKFPLLFFLQTSWFLTEIFSIVSVCGVFKICSFLSITNAFNFYVFHQKRKKENKICHSQHLGHLNKINKKIKRPTKQISFYVQKFYFERIWIFFRFCLFVNFITFMHSLWYFLEKHLCCIFKIFYLFL